MITVGILTRDRLGMLRACVDSLLPQLAAEDEIVVLDTGSVDGTREWLAEQAPPLRAIHSDSSAESFAGARNKLVASALGTIVAFVDDDCVVPPDWLARIQDALARHRAVGGQVLPGKQYCYPWWWHGQMTWAVGLSGPSLFDRADDSYPAAANLAAHKDEFLRHPFQVTQHRFGEERAYMGGREDAQWWFDARIRGSDIVVDPRLLVFHSIPASRINYHYVIHRAVTDGRAAWIRSPSMRRRELSLHDAGWNLGEYLCQPLRALLDLPASVSRWIWIRRQLAHGDGSKHHGGNAASEPQSTARLGVRHVKPVIKYRMGPYVANMVKLLRPKFRAPQPPGHILVAVPTYLGDCVLVQSLVRMLVHNWPRANIVVLSPYPEIYAIGEATVHTLTPAHCNEPAFRNYALWASDVNFVPYYHFGDMRFWRRVLSMRAVTFNCDTGFPRNFDHLLAPIAMHKDTENHELFNLLRLFSIWPMAGDLEPPRLKACDQAQESLANRFPALKTTLYVTVQLGSGLAMKEWPVERWGKLASELSRQKGMTVVFIGDASQQSLADRLIADFSLPNAMNLCGQLSTAELIALLAEARIAVGSCSGPKHVAMALGTPTFTVYGPSSPVRWGALFDRHLHGYVCSPVCYLSPVEHADLEPNHAMQLVSAEAAAEKLFEHLQSLGGGATG